MWLRPLTSELAVITARCEPGGQGGEQTLDDLRLAEVVVARRGEGLSSVKRLRAKER